MLRGWARPVYPPLDRARSACGRRRPGAGVQRVVVCRLSSPGRQSAGAARTDANVTVYNLAKPHPRGLPQSGVVHQNAIASVFQETLRHVHPSLPAQASLPLSASLRLTDASITQRNTPPLFGDGQIDAITNDDIIGNQRQSAAARALRLDRAGRSQIRGRVARLADGRIGRFGWKLEFASLGDFVKAACANELGLSNPGRPQATPLGRPDYKSPGVDLTDDQCGLMADFIRALPPPIQALPAEPKIAEEARAGRLQFASIGCVDCHSESVGPARGLYSDLLLHDMGTGLEGEAGYCARLIRPAPARKHARRLPAALTQRVANGPALGGRRLGALLARRPRAEPRPGHRAPRRRGVRSERTIQVPVIDRETFAHRISQDPQGPRRRFGRARPCLAVI